MICECQFEITPKNKKDETREFCSKSCCGVLNNRKRNINNNKTEKAQYRSNSAFKFNVYNFPEEFNLALIEEFGWYSAANRGNNLYGVSRDHMISCDYGRNNNISAEHLAHPANCELISQSKNASKGVANSITYDELLIRIKQWDEKYGVYNRYKQ